MPDAPAAATHERTMPAASTDRTTHPTTASLAALIDQASALVRSLTDEDFIAPCARLMGSTIGQHLRHSMDHIGAALDGADGAPIDYDHRLRGAPVETSRDAAAGALSSLRARLGSIDAESAERDVEVRVMLAADGEDVALRSSLARELAFAGHHAIHHYAMMASIAHERGVAVPAGFGKAPSTLRHEASNGR